jgi:hypothetical protein
VGDPMARKVSPVEAAPPESKPEPANDEADKLLERVAPPSSNLEAGGGALRAARIVSVGHGVALIRWRGNEAHVAAVLAPGLEVALLEEVIEEGGSVLVEEGPPPLVVGVLQTRRPRELKLQAGTITLEGEREVMIRAGRAAIRLREDGDIEIVGSRISAASRGLFRLVGRILRLN